MVYRVIVLFIILVFSKSYALEEKQSFSLDIKNLKNNTVLPAWGEKNTQIITEQGGAINYLRIHFPKGSANPGSSPGLPRGGTQFYKEFIDSDGPVTLSYLIRFPLNFPFDSANPKTSKPYTIGKLPGLYGGKGNTGTHIPDGVDGWTTRFMWCDYIESEKKKVRAGGEILLFSYTSDQGQFGHDYGTHLGCNQWNFSADNKWHKIQQTIILNTPGIANGRLDVCYDGELVFTKKGIIFRTVSSLKIKGLIFQTFFGGSGAKYATPVDTYIDFAEFKLRNYPASVMGKCV